MLFRLTIIPVAFAFAVSSLASAASLGGVTGQQVGAGETSISACDTVFTLVPVTTNTTITAMKVGGIDDPACEGGSLQLTLKDSVGASVGSGGPLTIPTDGDTIANTVTVTVSPTPINTTVTDVSVAVVGP